MYDELVNRRRDFAVELRKAEDALLVRDAADAIEELTGFVQEAERDRDEYRERLDKANDAIEELSAAEKKYLANISALETENQHLKRERYWIPVTERLPNGKAERYLVAASLMARDLRVSICYYADNLEEVDEYDFKDEKRSGFYGYDDEYGYYERSGVKYWMPLPEPPKEERA